MKTRNQIKQEEEAKLAEFTPKFFDNSSKAWMKNKVRDGLMYKYKPAAFQEPLALSSPPLRRSKRLLEKNTAL
jgi:hypothetical protein